MASPAPQPTQALTAAPTSDAVGLELQRVLASRAFSTTARMRQLLHFIVESTIAGREDHLKETGIGMAVFGREAGYDPKTDSIVRAEVRRLRKRLDIYYEDEGKNDLIIIELPKGRYVPFFKERPGPIVPVVEPESEQPGQPGIPAVRRSSMLRWLVITGLTAALATWGLVESSRRPQRADSSWPFGTRVTPVTSFNTLAVDPAVSPDGKRLAFVWNGADGKFNLYTKGLDGGTPERLTKNFARDLFPNWSWDGTRIAFLRAVPEGLRLYWVGVHGAQEHLVTDIKIGQWFLWNADPVFPGGDPGPAWSPDGNFLFAADTDSSSGAAPIWRFALTTGKRVQITRPGKMENDFFPAVSPDGRYLAFTRQQSVPSRELCVTDLRTGKEQCLPSELQDIQGLTWCPNSDSLVFSSNRSGGYRLWRIQVPGGNITPVPAFGAHATNPSMSRDGKVIVYANAELNSNIWSVALQNPFNPSTPAAIVLGSSGANEFPALSPDGASIAWASDRSGSWEIWIAQSDGNAVQPLTHFGTATNGRLLGSPQWSPDGRRIAFDARPEGHATVFVTDVEHRKTRRLETNDYEERIPTWSRDGRWIYFNSNRDGTVRIWKRSSNGGQAIPVVSRESYYALESHDGSLLYFLPSNAEPGIYQVPVSGGAGTLVPGSESYFVHRQWDVTKDGIFFAAHESEPLSIVFLRFRTGKVELVRRLSKPLVTDKSSLSVDDGLRRLIFCQQDEAKSDIFMLRGDSR